MKQPERRYYTKRWAGDADSRAQVAAFALAITLVTDALRFLAMRAMTLHK